MPDILPTVANATPSPESSGPEAGPRAKGGPEDSQDRFSDVSRREKEQMDQRSTERNPGEKGERTHDTRRDSDRKPRTDQPAGSAEGQREIVLKTGEDGKPALTVDELKQLLEQAESGEMPFAFVSQGASMPQGKTGSLDLTLQGLSLGKAMGMAMGMANGPGLNGQGQGQSQSGALNLMQVMGFSGEGTGSQGMERLASLFNAVSGSGESGKALDFSAELSSRLPGQAELSGVNRNQSMAGQNRTAEGMAPLKNYATSVELPVQHAEWGEKVAGKLAWLTSQRMSAAEIHVVPPDMGPLDVRVQVQNDQANVTVHATHSAVRDQLELNSHRLRDMLQDNGLNLEKFEVSADASGEQASAGPGEEDQSGRPGGDGTSGAAGESDAEDSVTSGGEMDIAWRGEVDLYA